MARVSNMNKQDKCPCTPTRTRPDDSWLSPMVMEIKVFLRNLGNYSGGEPFRNT